MCLYLLSICWFIIRRILYPTAIPMSVSVKSSKEKLRFQKSSCIPKTSFQKICELGMIKVILKKANENRNSRVILVSLFLKYKRNLTDIKMLKTKVIITKSISSG